MRLTDNRVELSVRFLAPEHGTRRLKDQISREIIKELEDARIGIAFSSMEIFLPKEVRERFL